MRNYIVYIDEAGDPGIKRYSTGDPRYEWFTVGAAVVRAEHEPDIVNWIREASAGAKGRQAPALHYRDLTPGAKIAVCKSLGERPMRGFVLASHKSNMRRHLNKRLTTEERASRFYNWCIRILLERVTEWCLRQSIEDYGEKRPVSLVFSHRGGHNYDKLFWYLFTKLKWQEEANMLFLGRPVNRGIIDPEHTEVISHESRAGLQLADVIASAFFQGSNSGLANFDTTPAENLRKIMARARPNSPKTNFGVTLLPFPEQAPIPEEDRGLFRFYGYNI